MFSFASVIPLRKAALDYIHSLKERVNHVYFGPVF